MVHYQFEQHFIFQVEQHLKKFMINHTQGGSFFGGFGCWGVVGGHSVEITKAKKRKLSMIRRAVTTRTLVFEECEDTWFL